MKKSIARKIAEGRGHGIGSDYIPWLTVREVPSRGLSFRIIGWKTGRMHTLLSKLELSYFMILEWSRIVVDIREQYPLELEDTIALAEEQGIRHPKDPKSKNPVVMTTDFLVSTRQEAGTTYRARTVKPSRLLTRRTLEKFQIEREYWKRKGIDFGIVTEKQIPSTLASNVWRLHPYRRSELSGEIVERVAEQLFSKLGQQNLPLNTLTTQCDSALGLPPGSSLLAVYHLLATGRWTMNMDEPLQPWMPLTLCRHECDRTAS